MKLIRLITTISTALALLFLTSCNDKLNVLVIPKLGNCFAGKISYGDWTGRDVNITLFDKDNNTKVCKGKYSMIEDAGGCIGKKFQAEFICADGRTGDLNFATTSCTESYGIAVDDLGNKYEVYIGISEEMMKSKITAYTGFLQQ